MDQRSTMQAKFMVNCLGLFFSLVEFSYKWKSIPVMSCSKLRKEGSSGEKCLNLLQIICKLLFPWDSKVLSVLLSKDKVKILWSTYEVLTLFSELSIFTCHLLDKHIWPCLAFSFLVISMRQVYECPHHLSWKCQQKKDC